MGPCLVLTRNGETDLGCDLDLVCNDNKAPTLLAIVIGHILSTERLLLP